jgi:molecular chaperone GrpE
MKHDKQHHHHGDAARDEKHPEQAGAQAGQEAHAAGSGTGGTPVSSSDHCARAQGEETHGRDAHATETHGQDARATELEKMKAERDDLLARLQRVSADYMNYQKRAHRDAAEACEYGNADLIKSMLPVLDDMERSIEVARKNHDEKDPLLVGMQLVHDKALEVMGRFGLSVMKAQGQPFDPQMHQALMQEPSDKVPPNTVLRELQKGYILKGRAARPAAVVVSKEPSQERAGGDLTEADAED